ncbi:MAG TPA: 2-amino-4-hydroxy-6-hydroxymethyldihydropteridine diphosphokinase [Rhizomicrobium sp.]|jgi:2-amino-4-hydroxy-6-hydroxymethyldihydropteridine diphosphokinase|nr:2-amino-4-hydroxy-6-hydroxymethyldihydropteridine diphosphokinase [Rhizomicrobium sp.]
MILIALGANLPSKAGPPRATLEAALKALMAKGVRIESVSAFYETEAWPNPADPTFVNAVARVATELPPRELMAVLHEVETSFGRKRSEKNAPRTLDLDLIDYQGRIEDGPPTLPHPRASARAFVLVPLKDVAPDWRHPVTGQTLETALAKLGGAARVRRI